MQWRKAVGLDAGTACDIIASVASEVKEYRRKSVLLDDLYGGVAHHYYSPSAALYPKSNPKTVMHWATTSGGYGDHPYNIDFTIDGLVWLMRELDNKGGHCSQKFVSVQGNGYSNDAAVYKKTTPLYLPSSANLCTVGLAMQLNGDAEHPSQKQIDSVNQVMDCLSDSFGFDRQHFWPHRMLTHKSCPGKLVSMSAFGIGEKAPKSCFVSSEVSTIRAGNQMARIEHTDSLLLIVDGQYLGNLRAIASGYDLSALNIPITLVDGSYTKTIDGVFFDSIVYVKPLQLAYLLQCQLNVENVGRKVYLSTERLGVKGRCDKSYDLFLSLGQVAAAVGDWEVTFHKQGSKPYVVIGRSKDANRIGEFVYDDDGFSPPVLSGGS